MILKEEMGVVSRWLCDGCGLERTALHGYCEHEGNMFCASCIPKRGLLSEEVPGLRMMHSLAFEDGGAVVRDMPAETLVILLKASVASMTSELLEGRRLLCLSVARHPIGCMCEPCVTMDLRENTTLGCVGSGVHEPVAVADLRGMLRDVQKHLLESMGQAWSWRCSGVLWTEDGRAEEWLSSRPNSEGEK